MVQRRDFSTIRPTHKKFCLNARPCKLFRLQTVSLSQLMFTLEKAKYLSVYGLCSAQHCLTDGMVTQPLTFAEQRPDYFGVQLNGTHCECITTISFGEQWVVVVKLSRLTNSHMTQFGARHLSYSSCCVLSQGLYYLCRNTPVPIACQDVCLRQPRRCCTEQFFSSPAMVHIWTVVA